MKCLQILGLCMLCVLRVKENQIVINCQKLEEISWYELKKPASP